MHTQLENRFADRKLYKAISAKILLNEESLEVSDQGKYYEHDMFEMCDMLYHYLQFIQSTHDVHAITLGYHENGKNLTPHIHVHSIVSSTPDVLKDRSKQRLKFSRQNCFTFKGISERVQDLDDNNLVFNFLAYPMKEGKIFLPCLYNLDKKEMGDELLLSLIKIARTIYNGSCADQANRERSEERKKANFDSMWEVAKCFEGQNITLPMFNAYMHEAYFKKLPRDMLPTPKNGNDNLWKCAFILGLVRYEVK